jgi:UDP-glucose 4-epimerase
VFLGKALRRAPIEVWGDGTVVRDYLHISDVVRALLTPLTKSVTSTPAVTSPIYNIGSGHGVSINSLLAAISQVTGTQLAVKYLPGRDFDVPVNVLDIQRAKTQLGWQPQVTLTDGLRKTWRWMHQEYGDIE